MRELLRAWRASRAEIAAMKPIIRERRARVRTLTAMPHRTSEQAAAKRAAARALATELGLWGWGP